MPKSKNNLLGGVGDAHGYYVHTISQVPGWAWGDLDRPLKSIPPSKIEVFRASNYDDSRCAFVDKMIRDKFGDKTADRLKELEKIRLKGEGY